MHRRRYTRKPILRYRPGIPDGPRGAGRILPQSALTSGDLSSSRLGKHHVITLRHLENFASNTENPPGEPSCPSPATFDSIGKGIIDTLKLSIHFSAAWLFKFDPDSLRILDIYLYRFSQESFSRYLDLYYSRCPIPTLRQMKDEGFVSARGTDFLQQSVWLDQPFYREVIQPLGLTFFVIVACVDEKGNLAGLIVLWRSHDRRDFSRPDVLFLQRASTLCANILKQSDTSKADPEHHAMEEAIGARREPGVIIMGAEGRIFLANEKARSILKILASGKKQLPRTEEERFMRILRVIRNKVLGEGTLQKRELACPCEIISFWGTVFSFRGLPLQGRAPDQDLALILIETVKERESSVLTRSFVPGFTPREDAVAKRVGFGYTNKQIAAELGIGVHTVKDHVRNIMKKLNTHTRSGIAGKLAGNALVG